MPRMHEYKVSGRYFLIILIEGIQIGILHDRDHEGHTSFPLRQQFDCVWKRPSHLKGQTMEIVKTNG